MIVVWMIMLCSIKKHLRTIDLVLPKHNLIVNSDKTEKVNITRCENRSAENWRQVIKLSRLLRDPKELIICKIHASAASAQLLNVWKKSKRVQLKKKRSSNYNSIVLSVLLYKCDTLTTGNADAEKPDAFHRKQLRKVLNIAYLQRSPLKMCPNRPALNLSVSILKRRWSFLGRALRLPADIPCARAIKHFFDNKPYKCFTLRARISVYTT